MHRRPAYCLSALFLLVFLVRAPLCAQDLAAVEPERVGVSSERLGRLNQILQLYVDEGRLPGAALIVARDGGVIFQKAVGYRDLEAAEPLRTDDLFRIASQTKALVSVGIMILQERGALLISDRLSDYLPAFDGTTVAVPTDGEGYEVVASERPITLRHLLTHTAGIGYGGGPAADRWEAAGIQGWYFADRDEPIAATVERMASLPMDAQPGERFVYG